MYSKIFIKLVYNSVSQPSTLALPCCSKSRQLRCRSFALEKLINIHIHREVKSPSKTKGMIHIENDMPFSTSFAWDMPVWLHWLVRDKGRCIQVHNSSLYKENVQGYSFSLVTNYFPIRWCVKLLEPQFQRQIGRVC